MAGLPALIHLLLAFVNFGFGFTTSPKGHHRESSAALPTLSCPPLATRAQFGAGNLVNPEVAELRGKIEEIQNSLTMLMMPNTTSSVATPSSLKQLNANMLPDTLASTPTIQDSSIMPSSSSKQQDASEVTSSLDPTATHDLLALESTTTSSATGLELLRANKFGNKVANSHTLPTKRPPILITVGEPEICFHNGTCTQPTYFEFNIYRLTSDAKTVVVEGLLLMCKVTPALSLFVLQTHGTVEGLKKVLRRKVGLSKNSARSISTIVALPLISIGFYFYFGSFHFILSFVVYVFYRYFLGD
ncbi:hypothetical protein IWZ01DRAFT_485750 [Phyllosticta capitalensis]